MLLQLPRNCSGFLKFSHVCRPATNFLREVDSDGPCMGKVYHRSLQLQQEMEAVEWLDPAQQKWLSARWAFRWMQLHSDMHACGEQLCTPCSVCSKLHLTSTALPTTRLLQAMCWTLSTCRMTSPQRWHKAFCGTQKECFQTSQRQPLMQSLISSGEDCLHRLQGPSCTLWRVLATCLAAGKRGGCSAMVTTLRHLGSSGGVLEQRRQLCESWPGGC